MCIHGLLHLTGYGVVTSRVDSVVFVGVGHRSQTPFTITCVVVAHHFTNSVT
eukprot:m.139580 g.139580  ORF g.139580 m.139580 type:complete len:52 (-) comp14018_c0_seq1:1283-1438(-)